MWPSAPPPALLFTNGDLPLDPSEFVSWERDPIDLYTAALPLPGSQCFLLAGGQAHTLSLTLPGLSHLPTCAFKVPAAQVSLALFGGKVSGAAADPVAGFFINRSRRTGSGRLMPW